jgi:hypothetical protein
MDPDLRRHIIALLELGIEHIEHGGLNETRLSKLEQDQNLSRDKIRETIKHLIARGALNPVIEGPELPYGVSQAFVTDTGKLYYSELVEESGDVGKAIPPVISDSLRAFKKDHPDPMKTAFIMMSFSETQAHDRILRAVKETLASHGLSGVRSDLKQYHNSLLYNVLTYAHGCGFGIAVFERIESDEFNPNVSFEVGYMLGLKKEVCLLKDKTLDNLSTDLLGELYKPFDPQAPENTIPSQLSQWLYDKSIAKPPPSSTRDEDHPVVRMMKEAANRARALQ